MLYKVLPSSDPSGGEEEQDDGADRGSAAVGNPCRGHQPLHGHLQEDEPRLLRPLRLFLQLHHVSRAAAALRLGHVLRDEPLERLTHILLFVCGHQSCEKPVCCFAAFSASQRSFCHILMSFLVVVRVNVDRCETSEGLVQLSKFFSGPLHCFAL